MKKYLIEMQPGGTRALAFGLSWHTTLGNEPDAVAARLAVREKAVAYTRGGSRSTVVGLLKTRTRAALPRAEVFSAAAVFARAFPRGPVALRMSLPGGVWLTAAYDGIVIVGTDIIHANDDDAQAHLIKLHQQYRHLLVYGDQTHDIPLPEHALAQHLDTSSRLTLTARLYARLPLSAWLLLGCFSTWILIDQGQQLYQSHLQRHPPAVASLPLPDPLQQWQTAIDTWASNVPNHAEGTLQTLLREIEQVPLNADRWSLTQIDCSPLSWACTARFKRGRLGSNQALRLALPAQWTLQWPDLDHAVAHWQLPGQEASRNSSLQHPLRIHALPTDTHLKLTWATRLQGLLPALNQASLGEANAVSIAPPMHTGPDGAMAAIPRPDPSQLSWPIARQLVVNGPMRSLYLLQLPTGSVIESLQIRHTPTTTTGLSTSTLLATLTGVLHAK